MAEFLTCTGPIFGFDSSNEMQKLARARQGLARLQGDGFPQEHFILLQESNFPFCKKTPFYENCFFPLRDKHFFCRQILLAAPISLLREYVFPPCKRVPLRCVIVTWSQIATVICDHNLTPAHHCDLWSHSGPDLQLWWNHKWSCVHD